MSKIILAKVFGVALKLFSLTMVNVVNDWVMDMDDRWWDDMVRDYGCVVYRGYGRSRVHYYRGTTIVLVLGGAKMQVKAPSGAVIGVAKSYEEEEKYLEEISYFIVFSERC